MRIAVIGAGISGVAAARVLTAGGHEVTVFERGASVGGVWTRAYPDVRLQNVAEHYRLSDFPWPVAPDLHPSGAQVLRYLEAAARHFRLDVRTRHEVMAMEHDAHAADGSEGGWTLSLRTPEGERRERFDFVVVASGQYSETLGVPDLPERERFAGPHHTTDTRATLVALGAEIATLTARLNALQKAVQEARDPRGAAEGGPWDRRARGRDFARCSGTRSVTRSRLAAHEGRRAARGRAGAAGQRDDREDDAPRAPRRRRLLPVRDLPDAAARGESSGRGMAPSSHPKTRPRASRHARASASRWRGGNVMNPLEKIYFGPQLLDRFVPLVGAEAVQRARRECRQLSDRLRGRIVWHVSAAAFGAVAELLRGLLPYTRGVGLDTRWVLLRGGPEFFRVTKRIQNAMDGERGDGSALAAAARRAYEAGACANLRESLAEIHAGDIVVLHDVEAAGLAPGLLRSGARVLWRCHRGADVPNAETALAWAFLSPYLRDVPAYLFTRSAQATGELARERCAVIPPSLDPFSSKNQPMDDACARAILAHVGIICGPRDDGRSTFVRADGSPGRVDRGADLIGLGATPAWDTPLVVQLSRWDRVKDPVGVLRGFARLVETGAHRGSRLVLAGPNVNAVASDPDSGEVFDEVFTAWRKLPHYTRQTIQLVSLPTADAEENGAIVNALQRHAAIFVQKGLHAGFGLTVTEAMWKARPVVASAVGGLREQITDGVDGLLLQDPSDLETFDAVLHRLLADPALGRRLGERAHERVRQRSLAVQQLSEYAALLRRLDEAPQRAAARAH